MKIKVCIAQYAVPESSNDARNKLDEIAQTASGKGVQLLVVPETALGMLSEVKTSGKFYLKELQEIAKQNNIHISTSFYQKEGEEIFNVGYCVSDKGEVITQHKKIYLAPPERDEDGISPGNEITVSDSDIGRIGVLVCKEGFNKYSHFLYERLNELNADILTIPTWSLTYKDKFSTQEYIKNLFVYGAMISNAYVLVSGNLNAGSFGRSLIVHPIKGILQEGSTNKEELLIEELDLDELKEIREFHKWWQPRKQVI